MNQRWSHRMLSLTWNHMGEDGSHNSWLFRFGTQEDFAGILQTFSQSLWETLHRIQWGKAKASSLTCLARHLLIISMHSLTNKIT